MGFQGGQKQMEFCGMGKSAVGFSQKLSQLDFRWGSEESGKSKKLTKRGKCSNRQLYRWE